MNDYLYILSQVGHLSLTFCVVLLSKRQQNLAPSGFSSCVKAYHERSSERASEHWSELEAELSLVIGFYLAGTLGSLMVDPT